MTDTRNRISFILYQNQNNKQKIPALIDSIRQLTMPPGFIVDVMAVTGQNRAGDQGDGC